MLRPFLLSALSAGMIGPALAQDQSRDVSGSLTYMPRIALPAGADVLVVVEGAFGTTLGETRFDTGDAQVPLPFSLTVPPRLSGELSAILRVDGQPLWIAQGLSISAGDQPVDLGMVVLESFSPLAFGSVFDCGGTEVIFGVHDDTAILRVGERDFEMQPLVAASGARYAAVNDESTEFWSKGDSAMLTLEGQEMGQCVAVTPQPDRYTARGNEPGWNVIVTDAEIEIVADYGALTLSAQRPEIELTPGAYVFDMPEIKARLTIEDQACADDATGMPYPHRAILMLEGRDLGGCGGDPASLLYGAEWQVDAIMGQEPVEGADVTIRFSMDGRVSGGTGCNRFMGGYTLSGEGLSLGHMGVTMMACPDALMMQERAMLDALGAVTRFEIDPTGSLVLIGGPEDSALLRARRD